MLFVKKFKLQALPSPKYNVRIFMYIYKEEVIVKRFYIPKARPFAKSKTILVIFYIQKSKHFTLRNFHEIFDVAICIQKHDILLYVTFFAKSKTIFVTVYMQKAWHFALRGFHGIFEICSLGGTCYIPKTMHFELNFYM